MKNIKCKGKNFKELKKRILNNVMSLSYLDRILKHNGYYGPLKDSLVKENANKFEITYKAADDYHCDLEVHFVIVAKKGDSSYVKVTDFLTALDFQKIKGVSNMKKIKLVYADGGYVNIEINLNEEELIDFYNLNNMTNDDINTQIKEIEIEADTVGFPGCSSRTIVYPFIYDKASECYLYE